jgi:hypothetical protein
MTNSCISQDQLFTLSARERMHSLQSQNLEAITDQKWRLNISSPNLSLIRCLRTKNLKHVKYSLRKENIFSTGKLDQFRGMSQIQITIVTRLLQ